MPPKGKGSGKASTKGGKADGKGKGKESGGKADGKGKGKDSWSPSGKAASSKGKTPWDSGKAAGKGKSTDSYGGWSPGGKGGKGKSADSGKAGGKGKGKDYAEESRERPERPTHEYSLDGRPYSAALQELFKGSVVRPNDFDPKAVQLLDALHDAGKDKEAIAHLVTSVKDVSRDKVIKMKAYIFSLLRAFDKDVYTAMKESRGRPRPRRQEFDKPSDNAMHASAPEFVPGQTWKALAPAPEFVPGQLWPGLPGLPFAQVQTPFNVGSFMPQVPAQAHLPMATPAPAAPAPSVPAAATLSTTPPGQAPKLVDKADEPSEGVTFSVECKTEMGETVSVVGSAPELGNWDVAGALKLATGPESFPVWKSDTVQLKTASLEYKFVILKDDKSVVRWEPTVSNRRFQKDAEGKVVKFGELGPV